MAKKITAETKIFDALEINPKAGDILMNYGMHCLGCALAHGETVGEAADVHGEKLLEELNDVEFSSESGRRGISAAFFRK